MHDRNDAKRRNATAEFNQHEHRTDGDRVTNSLASGLTLLRDLFYRRLHDDVERIIGQDSMLVPVSRSKSEAVTKLETELYQIAESAVAAGAADYTSDEAWFAQWLIRLRLGVSADNAKIQKRLADYTARDDQDRRLALTNVLARIFPESRRVPLILFRLFPLSARITTALAFDDSAGAKSLRDRQVELLPAILDCRECRGELLANGQSCPVCANPLWKWEILASV